MADYFFGKDPGPDIRRKLNEMVAIWQAAIDEAVGPRGWSPVISIASDGARRVHQIVDWTGGEGVKPTLTGYIGETGIVANIAQAVDIRGPQGAQGAKGDQGDQGDQGIQGPKGDKGDKGDTGDQGIQGIQGVAGNDGWTPVLAVVADDDRRVQQVTDWTGGQGTKPTTGQYVGATGLVSNIAQAVDIRGPVGSGDGNVNTTGTVDDGDLTVFDGATGDLIRSGGRLDPLALPDIKPTLNLNLMQKTHDPRIVVSRATEKTYWDQNGVLREAGPNEWPVEYDPATGRRVGRSVWGSRTNLARYSQQWSASVANVTEIARLVVDANDPTWFAEEAGTGEHYIGRFFQSEPSTKYAVSACFDLPPAGRRLTVRLVVGFGDSSVVVNADGTYTTVGTTPGDISVLMLPGGRVWVRFTIVSDDGSPVSLLRLQPRLLDGFGGFEGDPSKEYRAYFLQIERADSPSPYIPTEGSAVTRADDRHTMPTDDWLNPMEGTFVCDFEVGAITTIPSRFLLSLVGAGESRTTIYVGPSVLNIRSIIQTPAQQQNFNTTQAIVGGQNRMVYGYSAEQHAISLNGRAAATQGLTTPPPESLNNMALSWRGATSPSTDQLNGGLQRIVYYPRYLPLEQLQALSAL